MHIYAYGSICRGEIELGSDIDALALVERPDARLSPATYSVYPYARLKELWMEGNPFAWHLAIEARLLFAGDGVDFIRKLGPPAPYQNWRADSHKFVELYRCAAEMLVARRDTTVFELATIFLAMRNLAICYSLRDGASPVFSRRAFERLGPDSLNLDAETCKILDDARVLSTRGYGREPTSDEVRRVVSRLPDIDLWIGRLIAEGNPQ